MPTPDISLPELITTLPITGSAPLRQQLAGKGNLLTAARQTLERTTQQLRTLLNLAPDLRQTVHTTLHAELQLDPTHCGLRHGDSQVNMVTFATRLLAGPVFANPFADWTPWGFSDTSAYATTTAAAWEQQLGPAVRTAQFQAAGNYWDGRMPGSDSSRKAQANKLLRQHFTSNLDIAYGLGKIGISGWLHGREASAGHALVEWRLPTGTMLTSTAALLISPPAGQTSWLLYLPGRLNPVLAFNDLEAVRDWIFDNRFWFWSDPRYSFVTGTRKDVVITHLQRDGFNALMAEMLRQHKEITEHHLLQACLQSETDPLDLSDLQTWERQRSELVREALDATVKSAIDQVNATDTALAEEEVHFACLEQHLPIGWRKQSIERQETLLEQYLAGETAPTSAKVTLLRERQAALDVLQDAQDVYLLELPAVLSSASLKVHVGDKTPLEQISEGLCQALLKEACLQHTLGELSDTHLDWIEQLVDRPKPGLQRFVQASALELVAADRTWQLHGYMIFRALPKEDDQTHAPGILLYRPGQRGGLLAFEDESALARSLLATLQGAWPDALLEAAQPADAIQLLEALADSASASFNYTVIKSHFMQHCVEAIVAALPADSSKEHARQRLCISSNRARETALARFAENNRSSHIHAQLSPLHHLDPHQLDDLAKQVDALRGALLASTDLLRMSLPSRKQFTRSMLHQHLRTEFGIQDIPQITLDIADSVTVKKQVTGQSALGGAGSRDVPEFSKTRSTVNLESFILLALDDQRRLRLGNATIKCEPANPTLEQALTPTYITKLITQLDAAGSYEQRITQAYLGFAHESAWQVLWRQETLRAPYEHRLRLLTLSRPTSLDASGQTLLERFCQEQLDSTATRTIAYHTLELAPGTAADGSSNSVGLSGVSVIQDMKGPVLLYMPGAPNGKIITQHATAKAACEALQTMALDKGMVHYLATQTQSGDPDEHELYINQALQAGFQAFIEVGSVRTETLPTYETAQDMGELIREHRATSRSQADMALAAPEAFNRYFFLGLRLALGILPGAGTALALYDGWHAANAAVSAFQKSELEEGLQHLVSLLQSLTDAILTLAPLAASAGTPATTARQLTRQRQRLEPFRPTGGIRKTPPNPFAGYESELPAGPMAPSTHPQGAGVFEHSISHQHFISRYAAWYAVEWDPTNFTWRLKPHGLRTYRQPVRLSEQGLWETPGRLSGLLVDNGLQGGGGVLTTLYDQGVAYWRTIVRGQPRQLTGMDLAHDINDELRRIQDRMRTRQANYRKATQAVPEGARPTKAQRTAIANARRELVEELSRNITYNERSIARLREQRATLGRSTYARFTSVCEENISEMSVLEMRLVSARFSLATDEARRATNAIQALHGHNVAAERVERLTQRALAANREVIATLQEVERLAIRHQARRNTLQGNALTRYQLMADETGLILDLANAQLVRASILSMTLFQASAVGHPQVGAFMTHFHEQGTALRSTLFSHLQLPQASLSRAQERTFLRSAQSHYARFLSHVTAWEDNFQDLLSPNENRSLRQLLRQLIDDIENSLDRANVARRPSGRQPGHGASRPRLFETVEGPLIGTEYAEGGQVRMRINQPHSNQPHTTYTRNEAGQWQLSAAERAAPTQTMASLMETATARLDDVPRQQARLRQYQTPQTLPVDLQDIAEGHAQQLRFIADRIRQKAGDAMTDGQQALRQRLNTAAEQMETLGRELRIAQTKASRKPTVGYLEYLLAEQEVEIAWSRTLNPKLDRKGNPVEYLEEYRIVDRNTRQALWYAHFHFRQKPAQGFNRLEAGHLKLASERDLSDGAWRGSMSEAQANRLFGNLRPAT